MISIIRSHTKGLDVDKLNQMGIGIEVQGFPQSILDDGLNRHLKDWRDVLRGIETCVSLHGASFDLHPGTTDKRVLEVTRYRYKQAIDIAKEIGASYIVFHSQVNPSISVNRIRQMIIDNHVAFLKDLLKDLPEGISLLIENEYDDTYEDLKQIVEGVSHQNLKVCLDTGHVLAYSKESLEKWFHNLQDHIEYIHLHWNDGSGDHHDRPSDEDLTRLKNILDNYKLKPHIIMEYGSDDIYEEAERVYKRLCKKTGL